MSLGFAGATQGYFFRKTTYTERILLFIGAFCVIPSQVLTNIIGVGIIGITLIMQILLKPKEIIV